MTPRKLIALLILLSLSAVGAMAQGLNTVANKDDWEEINFEFNSATLADGFPSLLRIAELLSRNSGYKVEVTGHTDSVGSHPYNDKLAVRRAEAVKAFLEKYGARPGQVSLGGRGKREPKVSNTNRDGRFMNRRVTTKLVDGKGSLVAAGGPGDIIDALEKHMKRSEDCCNEVLKRLDKLDEILSLLRDLKAENARLRDDVEALKSKTSQAQAQAATPPPAPAPTQSNLSELAEKAAKAVSDMQARPSRFSLLGLNAGPDGSGDIAMSGRGRYFAPFNKTSALQAQGEYMYFADRREGQFDIGLVNRWKSFQMGGFSSLRNIWLKGMQSTGTLGQASFTGDYLFGSGKVGVYGAKAFLNDAVINRAPVGRSRNLLLETYLHAVDQLGASGTVALGRTGRSPWLEGNFGWLKSGGGNKKAGGTARLVFPLSNLFAFTAEGGVNETLVGPENNGRAVFGILFGNYTHPREFLAADHPVPVDIPRVRYEILTRRTRAGNDPPVADAGPDQIGVRPGTIQLDGSASFDPDGDPITFQWSQIAGPTVALSAAAAAQTNFTAAEGQAYAFRLLVTDSNGAQGIARVNVTTREPARVRIVRFVANPTSIAPGGASVLNWVVENADTVTISGVSQPLNPNSGTADVRPTQTTTYILTARNRTSEETATATVTVDRAAPRFVSCSAAPASIPAGGSATISWQSENATAVEVLGVGVFGPSGATQVAPQTSTTYTLLARGDGGQATCNTTVIVQGAGGGGQRPTIVTFGATPPEIVEGGRSTLSWRVTGADSVSIDNGVGEVAAAGSRDVSPAATTTYTLTARNSAGETIGLTTLTVFPRVRVISFTATPETIPARFSNVRFDWSTENATEVFITVGIGRRPPNGSLLTSGPGSDTIYTLTAVGRGDGNTATASLTVRVAGGGGPGDGRPPEIRFINDLILTRLRTVPIPTTAVTYSDPDGGTLTYAWRSLDGRLVINGADRPYPVVVMQGTDLGDFPLEVTVRDPEGNTSRAQVLIRYIAGPHNERVPAATPVP